MEPCNHEHPVYRDGVIDYELHHTHAMELRREALRTALTSLGRLIAAFASGPRQIGDSAISNISTASRRAAG